MSVNKQIENMKKNQICSGIEEYKNCVQKFTRKVQYQT